MTIDLEKPTPLDPADLASLASYYNVDLKERREFYLLAAVKAAAIAQVKYPWVESEDEHGMLYTNAWTKETSRRHPLDHKFLDLIRHLRAKGAPPGPERPWMLFELGGGKPFYYNFADGTRALSVPPEQVVLPVAKGVLPTYTSETARGRGGGEGEGDQAGPSSTVPRSTLRSTINPIWHSGGACPPPPTLRFTSWWSEEHESEDLALRTDGETAGGGLRSRYVRLSYDVASGTCSARMDNSDGPEGDVGPDAITIPNVKVLTFPAGRPASPWDLHVGARVSLLGRTITLQQASRETTEWLEEHARRLDKLKERALSDLNRYQQKALLNAVVWRRGPPGARGGACLQSLIDQTAEVLKLLSKYRPGYAAKEAAAMRAMGYPVPGGAAAEEAGSTDE